MASKIISYGLIFTAVFLYSTVGAAQPVSAKLIPKKSAHKTVHTKPVASRMTTATSSAASMKRTLASATPNMKSDPNHAVEIRGQSRTLSMMLVLKNSKESINFIKIRKDYSPEIAGTPF